MLYLHGYDKGAINFVEGSAVQNVALITSPYGCVFSPTTPVFKCGMVTTPTTCISM